MVGAQNGHLEVVRALLEAGGRELLMLTYDVDGSSCLLNSAEKGHVDIVTALLEAGGRELLMLTKHNGASCLSVTRQANQEEVCRLLEMAFQIAGLSRDHDPQRAAVRRGRGRRGRGQ